MKASPTKLEKTEAKNMSKEEAGVMWGEKKSSHKILKLERLKLFLLLITVSAKFLLLNCFQPFRVFTTTESEL